MPKTIYRNHREVNQLQEDIMKFVDWWVHEEKTPVPHKEIIAKMKEEGVIAITTIKALGSLIKKGYLRRGYISSNKTFYVQLRRI
ncbi:hypothetical protein CMO96_05040 [Candidatus Woesebacteria bacterium]|nr:hypothetical protein [Candidatus Woesebacteria bacterium]